MIYINNKAILPDCPYCGAKLGYLESFVTKNRAVYKCKSCKNKSAVDLKHIFYNALWIIQAVCVIVFIFAVSIGGGFVLFGLSLILIAFVGFYGVSPYMVILKKPEIKIQEKKAKVKKKKQESNLPKTDVLVNQTDEESFSDKDIFSS